MKLRIIIIVILSLIIFTNLPIVDKIILSEIDGNGHFKYSNADGSFTTIQYFGFKDGYVQPDLLMWGFMRKQKPSPENRIMYRLYKINPLCFWRWTYYILSSRKFPYRSWEDIEPNRVPYKPNNMWQEF